MLRKSSYLIFTSTISFKIIYLISSKVTEFSLYSQRRRSHFILPELNFKKKINFISTTLAMPKSKRLLCGSHSPFRWGVNYKYFTGPKSGLLPSKEDQEKAKTDYEKMIRSFLEDKLGLHCPEIPVGEISCLLLTILGFETSEEKVYDVLIFLCEYGNGPDRCRDRTNLPFPTGKILHIIESEKWLWKNKLSERFGIWSYWPYNGYNLAYIVMFLQDRSLSRPLSGDVTPELAKIVQNVKNLLKVYPEDPLKMIETPHWEVLVKFVEDFREKFWCEKFERISVCGSLLNIKKVIEQELGEFDSEHTDVPFHKTFERFGESSPEEVLRILEKGLTEIYA